MEKDQIDNAIDEKRRLDEGAELETDQEEGAPSDKQMEHFFRKTLGAEKDLAETDGEFASGAALHYQHSQALQFGESELRGAASGVLDRRNSRVPTSGTLAGCRIVVESWPYGEKFLPKALTSADQAYQNKNQPFRISFGMDKGLIFPVQQCTDATLEPFTKVPWFAHRVDFLPSVPPLPTSKRHGGDMPSKKEATTCSI